MAPFDIIEPRIDSTEATPFSANNGACPRTANKPPLSGASIYDGGYSHARERGVRVRIANGTAGQIGLVRAWADSFIQYMVNKGEAPFQVAWYLGDSTASLALLASGTVDMALTYVPSAELQLMESGAASRRVYAFRDRFALVGPHCNPAALEEQDSVYSMFTKIVNAGNADVECPPDPDVRPATRFLSRCDKSATNIKESQIFLAIGQLPWGHDYSRWYHQFIRFPREALRAAAALSEYTLIDYGAWLSAPPCVRAGMRVYKIGSDAADDVLLNPAHLLYRGATSKAPDNEDGALSTAFYEWIVDPAAGMQVTLGFSKAGQTMYSNPPPSKD
ncbi:hypothetical protein HYPSUDRAFT_1096123 [Hypholoma sublateritium FD-334 SS-4]|uniref:PBP domain-containing protein n=1 Tax=Hypholoma sublateritium (strain FD-334 SS-4) TaxID=945553 RepID=A0A0D2M7V0_HYPSF|nr:hypothetical protein HYPSUDRAFT_1096123 [Hypholoma sublateritium FD-334 SS-4]